MSEGSSTRLLQTTKQLSDENLQLQTDDFEAFPIDDEFDYRCEDIIDDDTEEFNDNNIHHQYLVIYMYLPTYTVEIFLEPEIFVALHQSKMKI